MIQVQIHGLDRVNKFFMNLSPNLKEETVDELEQFLKDVRKSAKLRAPRFTGYLASSIFVKRQGDKTVILEVTAPYAYEQETGEGLPRKVPVIELKRAGWTHDASRTRGGLKKAGGGKAPKGYFIKRSYKPFIQPALEHNLNKLASRMSKATIKAINKSRR